ncbi:MAG: hypothetical protein DAHOPDDO_02477 [Ignavibacteriaceae bacterium]|nr:hypothetical protein [Ignavibacteriaceae bacterium]
MIFEIFKVGTHTSDKGISKDYTLDDLNFIASTYNPSEDEAPIVIGHPADNDPAFGWVSSLSVSDDGRLIANAPDDKLHPDFLTALKDGRYKKRSISLTPEGKLRHVGFLGAAKPAVKGLADIQFSSPSSVVYEFEVDKENEPEIKTDRNSPEINNEQLSSLTQEINQLKETINSFQNNFSESEFSSTKSSIEKIQSQLNSLQANLSNNDFENFLESKVDEGSLTPAIKEKVLAVSNFAQSQNFSDDFSPVRFHTDLNKHLISLVNSFPKFIYYDNFAEKPASVNINANEFADFTLDQDSLNIHKKALQYMQANQGVEYLEAINFVSKQ